MSRNKKPRPTHKRGNRENPQDKAYNRCIRTLMVKMQRDPCPAEYAERVELITLTAMEAITHGHGTKAEWDSIAISLNQGWILAKNGIGAEAIPALEEAQEAMRRAIPRYHKSGKIVLDGDGLKAVRNAVDLWGEQIRMSSIGELEESARVVAKHYKYTQEKQA